MMNTPSYLRGADVGRAKAIDSDLMLASRHTLASQRRPCYEETWISPTSAV